MTDKDKLIFRDILQKTGYYNRKPRKSQLTGRDRYIKYDHDNDVSRILNSDIKLEGRGAEKLIIPSNIIDIYTKLEVLLGLKLSDTLTKACNLIAEIYKRAEIQNKKQYRNALNNFSIIQTYIYICIYTRDEYIQLYLYFFNNKTLCDI